MVKVIPYSPNDESVNERKLRPEAEKTKSISGSFDEKATKLDGVTDKCRPDENAVIEEKQNPATPSVEAETPASTSSTPPSPQSWSDSSDKVDTETPHPVTTVSIERAATDEDARSSEPVSLTPASAATKSNTEAMNDDSDSSSVMSESELIRMVEELKKKVRKRRVSGKNIIKLAKHFSEVQEELHHKDEEVEKLSMERDALRAEIGTKKAQALTYEAKIAQHKMCLAAIKMKINRIVREEQKHQDELASVGQRHEAFLSRLNAAHVRRCETLQEELKVQLRSIENVHRSGLTEEKSASTTNSDLAAPASTSPQNSKDKNWITLCVILFVFIVFSSKLSMSNMSTRAVGSKYHSELVHPQSTDFVAICECHDEPRELLTG